MGHVRDLWHDGSGARTARYGRGNRYEARYVDPAGNTRSQTFPNRQKQAADEFLLNMESSKLRGAYVDPKAGRISLRALAEEWLKTQTFDQSTWEATERRLRRHVLPHIGDIPIAQLRPSRLQAWVKTLAEDASPEYTRIAFGNVSTILSAAVDDELIAKNPCKSRSIRLPEADDRKVVPWPEEWVSAVYANMPDRYAIAVTLGACCGMRQGEALGLAVEDIDFLRGWIHVRRQIKIVGNRLVFAKPKGRKERKVPLPPAVALEIAEHIRQFPPVQVALPWMVPAGEMTTATLLLSNTEGRPMYRHSFNDTAWRPARQKAGVPGGRENGFHALRHFYASTLLDAGENINALAEYLGHEDPGFTLRTYTHLMPSSEARTRVAVDAVYKRTFGSFEGTEKGQGAL